MTDSSGRFQKDWNWRTSFPWARSRLHWTQNSKRLSSFQNLADCSLWTGMAERSRFILAILCDREQANTSVCSIIWNFCFPYPHSSWLCSQKTSADLWTLRWKYLEMFSHFLIQFDKFQFGSKDLRWFDSASSWQVYPLSACKITRHWKLVVRARHQSRWTCSNIAKCLGQWTSSEFATFQLKKSAWKFLA